MRIPPVLTRWLPSGPLLGLVGVFALFAVLLTLKGEPESFLSLQNLRVVLLSSAVPAVAALGMLLIIISGGIDLSVGAVVALVTVVIMQVFRLVGNATESVTAASVAGVAAGLLAGAVCGTINGTVLTQLRLTPFVATLGMFGVARGVAYWLSGRTRLSLGVRPEWVDVLARSDGGRLIFSPAVWSVLVLAVLVVVLLRQTVLGRYCYAVGSSEATARLCGVPVERVKVALYTVAGLLAGWAGVLTFARSSGGDPTGGVDLALEAIAAVVLGGASLNGGQGTVTGTLIGVLILKVLENGVDLLGVQVEVKYILIGVVIIANTTLGRWQRRDALM